MLGRHDAWVKDLGRLQEGALEPQVGFHGFSLELCSQLEAVMELHVMNRNLLVALPCSLVEQKHYSVLRRAALVLRFSNASSSSDQHSHVSQPVRPQRASRSPKIQW